MEVWNKGHVASRWEKSGHLASEGSFTEAAEPAHSSPSSSCDEGWTKANVSSDPTHLSSSSSLTSATSSSSSLSSTSSWACHKPGDAPHHVSTCHAAFGDVSAACLRDEKSSCQEHRSFPAGAAFSRSCGGPPARSQGFTPPPLHPTMPCSCAHLDPLSPLLPPSHSHPHSPAMHPTHPQLHHHFHFRHIEVPDSVHSHSHSPPHSHSSRSCFHSPYTHSPLSHSHYPSHSHHRFYHHSPPNQQPSSPSSQAFLPRFLSRHRSRSPATTMGAQAAAHNLVASGSVTAPKGTSGFREGHLTKLGSPDSPLASPSSPSGPPTMGNGSPQSNKSSPGVHSPSGGSFQSPRSPFGLQEVLSPSLGERNSASPRPIQGQGQGPPSQRASRLGQRLDWQDPDNCDENRLATAGARPLGSARLARFYTNTTNYVTSACAPGQGSVEPSFQRMVLERFQASNADLGKGSSVHRQGSQATVETGSDQINAFRGSMIDPLTLKGEGVLCQPRGEEASAAHKVQRKRQPPRSDKFLLQGTQASEPEPAETYDMENLTASKCMNFSESLEICKERDISADNIDGLSIISFATQKEEGPEEVLFALFFQSSPQTPVLPGDQSTRFLFPQHLQRAARAPCVSHPQNLMRVGRLSWDFKSGISSRQGGRRFSNRALETICKELSNEYDLEL